METNIKTRRAANAETAEAWTWIDERDECVWESRVLGILDEACDSEIMSHRDDAIYTLAEVIRSEYEAELRPMLGRHAGINRAIATVLARVDWTGMAAELIESVES